MDSKYQPQLVEEKIYKEWEEKDLLKPTSNKKPFTILMPPPNANASLHAGHGMYTVDDILTRYKRLRGYDSLWIPGTDHAGFETQYVYEKYLAKQGKSRLDFDRKTFYDNVFDFVKENSGLIYQQFRKLGFLADWSRSVFSLDNHVLDRAFETFKQMESEGKVYKSDYIVNYCTHCGTSLAELEVNHIERKDPLYYLKYGELIFATVRPETVFVDVALAVNPKDSNYKKFIGQRIKVNGLFWLKEIPVIADEMVDMKFGTGVVKITPAHDSHDFEVGKKNKLVFKSVIQTNGKLTELAGPYAGLRVKAAREKFVGDLKDGKYGDFFVRVDENYVHSVTVCYKCSRDLEPTVIANWFIKVEELKKPVIKAVKTEKIKFYPKKYKKQMLDWLEIMHDWPISRQIAWGIRIPVWYKVTGNENKIWLSFLTKKHEYKIGSIQQYLSEGFTFQEIEEGLQQLTVQLFEQEKVEYVVSKNKPDDGNDWIQETDTFDTWFSSGQWPLVTLKDDEYTTRFPTNMMGTLADILKFWVSRMIMFSLYIKNEIPFKDVYLWSMVADGKGLKMSKSKGNVINPLDLVNKYGADAFRASLLFETGEGGKVILSEQKVVGMRNFVNKIWNMGRFINMNLQVPSSKSQDPNKTKILKELEKEYKKERKQYLKYMDSYQFSKALGLVYEFIWHRFADYYIEQLKDEVINGNIEALEGLRSVYLENLKMLHPFIPFVTEEVWKVFNKESILLNKL